MDVARRQRQVVQAAPTGVLERQAGLTDQGADVLGRQGSAAQPLGEGAPGDQLGDDEGEALLTADVQDPHQARVVQTTGPPGGVQHGVGEGVTGGHDAHDHGALEGAVVGLPGRLGGGVVELQAQRVAPAQQAAWSDPVQRHPS